MTTSNTHTDTPIFPEGVTPLKEFDTPAEISMYFGFAPIETPRITRDDRSEVSSLQAQNRSAFLLAPEEKTALLRTYMSLESLAHPLMVSYHRPRNVSGVSHSATERHIGLDIIGTSQSVADALAIRAACAILIEEGHPDLFVEINCIGDNESMEQFEKALEQHYRSRIDELPPKCRQMLTHSAFDVLQEEDAACEAINADAPDAISFLSEESREHFMDVLEHLEEAGIAYRINNTVVGNKHVSSHTVFSIRALDESGEPDRSLAMGTRYNQLAQHANLGEDIEAVGVSLSYTPKRRSRRNRKTPLQPRHYFCQLGDVAKRRSLSIIDDLRHHRIPVYHNIIHDQIRAQLERAEGMNIPYVLIMGQKEAMEESVVVRDMNTREQETVPIEELVDYLKKYAR